MEQLHQSAAGTDEDKDIAVAHIAPHPLVYDTAQRADALAHVCAAGTKEVAHRIVKAEHGREGF